MPCSARLTITCFSTLRDHHQSIIYSILDKTKPLQFLFHKIPVNGIQDLPVFSDGPHYVTEGNAVAIKCEVADIQTIEVGSTVVLQKQINHQFMELGTFLVSKDDDTKDRVKVVIETNTTFTFLFNTRLEDNGIYRCGYQVFPQAGFSNETEVFVQGMMPLLIMTILYNSYIQL